MDELKEATTKARRRSMGNIRFIGELYRLKMLTENIMHDCIFKLLKIRDDDSIECLTKLLETIGKDLDHPKAKVGGLNACTTWLPIMHSLCIFCVLEWKFTPFKLVLWVEFTFGVFTV